ncbi:MAG: UDP-glucose 4-epimerase GalE [Deltaproteobacteria bacterium]|nr:UDP-glucose 4-epimerase GalE [Deltaproteobacteria bacterium]
MSRSVLVVGGAGYIGSHMVLALDEAGFDVTTFDNLSTGHRDAVLAGDFVHGDLADRDALGRLFARRRFDLVMHFAACAYVRESMEDPRKYYRNNVVGCLNLLDAMLDAGVRRLVFSSSCATYGVAREVPITEEHPQAPVNPYGFTKLAIERALSDYATAYEFHAVALRYFNAAGADARGRLSERHEPETHLIPLVLREAARVRDGGAPLDTRLEVFGTTLATPDGSCVRDFVHVEDICAAHLAALERLLTKPQGFEAYNVGTANPASVLDVIAAARRVTGEDVRYRAAPAKAGDPPSLVATSTRARETLGWAPRHESLDGIVASAWNAAPFRARHASDA